MSLGADGVAPARSRATAAAHVLACELAANADFGIAPAMAASPMTWIRGCNFDSHVTGSIGHQPVPAATPATSALRPAFCGGMTLATFPRGRPKSGISLRGPAATHATAPLSDNGTQ